ncbi:MAG TPA: hypothetical protein VFW30_14010 [Bryocella sp.]|nr:hypothetical protein [Bryocella sp.]
MKTPGFPASELAGVETQAIEAAPQSRFPQPSELPAFVLRTFDYNLESKPAP